MLRQIVKAANARVRRDLDVAHSRKIHSMICTQIESALCVCVNLKKKKSNEHTPFLREAQDFRFPLFS